MNEPADTEQLYGTQRGPIVSLEERKKPRPSQDTTDTPNPQ